MCLADQLCHWRIQLWCICDNINQAWVCNKTLVWFMTLEYRVIVWYFFHTLLTMRYMNMIQYD